MRPAASLRRCTQVRWRRGEGNRMLLRWSFSKGLASCDLRGRSDNFACLLICERDSLHNFRCSYDVDIGASSKCNRSASDHIGWDCRQESRLSFKHVVRCHPHWQRNTHGSYRCKYVRFEDVHVCLRSWCITVSVVQGCDVRLVDPLPEDCVKESRWTEQHGCNDHVVGWDEGRDARWPHDSLLIVRVDARS